MVPNVEDVLNLIYLACKHSSGPPVPRSQMNKNQHQQNTHKMNPHCYRLIFCYDCSKSIEATSVAHEAASLDLDAAFLAPEAV